jgi:hypothetical protein
MELDLHSGQYFNVVTDRLYRQIFNGFPHFLNAHFGNLVSLAFLNSFDQNLNPVRESPLFSNYWGFGLRSSSRNPTFRKVDLFPSFGVGQGASTLLGPLERA